MTLTPVKRINNLTIYKRKRGREVSVPFYVVSSPAGKLLEEFRRFRSAATWCRQTTDFIGKDWT